MHLVPGPGYLLGIHTPLHSRMRKPSTGLIKNLIPLPSARIQTEVAPLETGLRAFPWLALGTLSLCPTSPCHYHP